MESTALYICHVNLLYVGEQNLFSDTGQKVNSLKVLCTSSEMSTIVAQPLPKAVVQDADKQVDVSRISGRFVGSEVIAKLLETVKHAFKMLTRRSNALEV